MATNKQFFKDSPVLIRRAQQCISDENQPCFFIFLKNKKIFFWVPILSRVVFCKGQFHNITKR